MKKIVSVAVLILVLVSFAVIPASADSEYRSYEYDYSDTLTWKENIIKSIKQPADESSTKEEFHVKPYEESLSADGRGIDFLKVDKKAKAVTKNQIVVSIEGEYCDPDDYNIEIDECNNICLRFDEEFLSSLPAGSHDVLVKISIYGYIVYINI